MLIAQLTDPHIKAGGRLAYGRVDTVAALKAAIAQINAMRPRVDVVMVTGDIVDAGSAEEYAFARPLFDTLEPPWFPLPGNHDAREPFQTAFADRIGPSGRGDFVQYPVDGYAIRLIAVDSTVAGEPYGRLCSARLDWLDETLRAHPDRPTMLFMHHPPFETGIRHMDVQNLRDADALIQVLGRHAHVRHIACGHVHRAIDTTVGGVPASIAPAPAHAVEFALSPDSPPQFVLEPPMLRLFQWAGGQLVSHLSHTGAAAGPYPFFDPSGRLIE